MRQGPEEMQEFAAECRRRAAAVRDPSLKTVFNQLALEWEDLAALRRRMDAERRKWSSAKGAKP